MPGAARVARTNLVLPRRPARSRFPDRWEEVPEYQRPNRGEADHGPDHSPVGGRPTPQGMVNEPGHEDQDVWPPGHQCQVEHHPRRGRGVGAGGVGCEGDERGHADHLTSLRCHRGDRGMSS